MFDWNDQDQVPFNRIHHPFVGDTIWAEFSESEDHIVPYPKGTEENRLLTYADYNKKQKTEENTVFASTEQTSRSNADYQGRHVENQPVLQTNGELSAPQLELESWPDLPSLDAALGRSYNNESDHDSMATAYLNDFNAVQNLDKVRDGQSEVFGNDHEDMESDNFLDCDWANIGDFDDLDRIFSNSDPIFGNEIIGYTGEFVSASSDVISSTSQSIPTPDLLSDRDQSSNHGSSSVHFNELSGGRSKPVLPLEEKVGDVNAKYAEQTKRENHATSEYSGKPSQSAEKRDIPKRLPKSRKKAEERSKNKFPQHSIGGILHENNRGQQFTSPNMQTFVKAPLQTFQSPAVGQHTQAGKAEQIRQLAHSHQFVISGYGYPACSFPSIPQMPNIYADRAQSKLPSAVYKTFLDSSKNSKSLDKIPDVPLGSLMMTPQEKIEKLRRRQQMQAMLAIQQQQQQFGQVSGGDTLVPQAVSPRKKNRDSLTSSDVVEGATNMVSSSEMTNQGAHDESQKISTMGDDPYLEERIYYQLQDALGKLDIRVRFCIRDSLLRLARSALERQSASDRSSTNTNNKDDDEVSESDETSRRKRCAKMGNAETYTNPIDRTVARLLFHKPSEKSVAPVKEESPLSPASFDPDSKVSLNTHRSTSEENRQNMGEMEMQPSS
ncbi:protein LNK2 isoform X2 [Ananas comosus]|uniref:Protein LNK2 isoform X2 n=1 Tax=Ananas comosus TaxID=4615 RepID=A0A6P5HIF4_ANACO|nr:protein LNK2 isoform X2 [Ananas comosus]